MESNVEPDNILRETSTGIYKCIKCEQILYVSTDKNKSEDWPSFGKAVDEKAILILNQDSKDSSDSKDSKDFGDSKDSKEKVKEIKEIKELKEIKCSKCFTHLGHSITDSIPTSSK